MRALSFLRLLFLSSTHLTSNVNYSTHAICDPYSALRDAPSLVAVSKKATLLH